MSYHDDMISWLKECGAWDLFSPEERARFEACTEDKARKVLVDGDECDMGGPEALLPALYWMTKRLCDLFDGDLASPCPEKIIRLSRAGKLLARAVLALRENGLEYAEIEHGFKNFNSLSIASLECMYRFRLADS